MGGVALALIGVVGGKAESVMYKRIEILTQ